MGKFILSAFADEIAPDLKTQMDVLHKHDISHIEMRGVNGKSLVQHNLSEVKEIKKQLDQRGFKISAVGSPIGKIKINDDFGPHLDLFRHTLDIADILETKYIRMFSFYMPKGDDPDDHHDEVVLRWQAFVDTAKDRNVILLHENEKDIYGDTPERCLKLIENMNTDIVKAVFDPANFVQCDVATYPHAYDMLENHIEYMHIKDAKFDNHSVAPSGYGDGNIRKILSALHKKDFTGFLSLEPHLGSFEGFSELENPERYEDMPEGGPKTFAVAAEALKKILLEVGGPVNE